MPTTRKAKPPRKPALLQSWSRQSLGDRIRGALFQRTYGLDVARRPPCPREPAQPTG